LSLLPTLLPSLLLPALLLLLLPLPATLRHLLFSPHRPPLPCFVLARSLLLFSLPLLELLVPLAIASRMSFSRAETVGLFVCKSTRGHEVEQGKGG
jgi:hypothetical protein